MMHRGRVIHDDAGADKLRLRPDDLLTRFEAVRRGELVDEKRRGDARSHVCIKRISRSGIRLLQRSSPWLVG